MSDLVRSLRALPLFKLAPPFGQAVREVGHERHWVAVGVTTLDEDSWRPLARALASHAGQARRDACRLAGLVE
eukprot:9141062-Pyramimonas_sp.AAC.1